MRILVVDDDPRVAKHVELKVGMAGHTVVSAPTLDEALRLFTEGAGWDIITIDGRLTPGAMGDPPDTLALVAAAKASGCGCLIAASSNPDHCDLLMAAGCTHRCEEKALLAKLVQQLVNRDPAAHPEVCT